MKQILLAHKQNKEVKNIMEVKIHLRSDNQRGDFGFLFSLISSIFGLSFTVKHGLNSSLLSSVAVAVDVDVDAAIMTFFFCQNDGYFVVAVLLLNHALT